MSFIYILLIFIQLIPLIVSIIYFKTKLEWLKSFLNWAIVFAFSLNLGIRRLESNILYPNILDKSEINNSIMINNLNSYLELAFLFSLIAMIIASNVKKA